MTCFVKPIAPSTMPLTASMGPLYVGEPKPFNVVIRGKKPFVIEKIECDSDRNCFAVRLPEGAKQIQVLPFTVTPPNEPGKFSEKFTVTISGRPEPLTFEAHGEILIRPVAAGN